MTVIDNRCLEYNHAKEEHAKRHTAAKDSYRKKVWICDFYQQLIVTVAFKYNSITWNNTDSNNDLHTQPFYGPFSGTTQVSWCTQKKSFSGLRGARADIRGRHTNNLA